MVYIVHFLSSVAHVDLCIVAFLCVKVVVLKEILLFCLSQGLPGEPGPPGPGGIRGLPVSQSLSYALSISIF